MVDLGSAWTKPHCILNNSPEILVSEWNETDRVILDDMVSEGLTLDDRGMPNVEYLQQLRPRKWK